MAPAKTTVAKSEVSKKGSPVVKKPKVDEPAAVVPVKPAVASEDAGSSSQDKDKRRSRNMYARTSNQLMTPFLTGLREHVVAALVAENVGTEEKLDALLDSAIQSYDARKYFSSLYESRGRNRKNRDKKDGTHRVLSTFMLFQAEMRPKVLEKLVQVYGRTPTQPELVKYLGGLWTELKKNGGTTPYEQKYEELKQQQLALQAAA